MLSNNYSNLYQSNFYRKQVAFFQENNNIQGLMDFELKFSLANVLYTESKKCIGFTDRDPKLALMSVVRDSALISAILSQDESVLDILREAESFDKITQPNERLSSLAASITVGEEHLRQLQEMSR